MNIEEFSEIPKAIYRSIDRQPLRDDKYDFIFFVNYALIFFDSRNWIRSCGDECYENIGRPSHVYRVGESGISWVLLTVWLLFNLFRFAMGDAIGWYETFWYWRVWYYTCKYTCKLYFLSFILTFLQRQHKHSSKSFLWNCIGTLIADHRLHRQYLVYMYMLEQRFNEKKSAIQNNYAPRSM